MKETSKSKQFWGPTEEDATQGHGIDIGCGPDPVRADAIRFDRENGDANRITDFVHQEFDYVYSSHCLEHMDDPRQAILEWWKLVKPGGHLFVVVPDEDLYEQGAFPSRFGPEHKATFTISKAKSWSSHSINVFDLARSLPGGEIVSLELQDRNYDLSLMSHGALQPGWLVRLAAKFRTVLCLLISSDERKGLARWFSGFYPVDQTNSAASAQAQIQLIVRKGRT